MDKYIPTEWFNGDTITAEKLNKVEDGVGDISDTLVPPFLNPGDKYFFTSDNASVDSYGNWRTLEQIFDTGGKSNQILGTDNNGQVKALSFDDIFAPEVTLCAEREGVFGYDSHFKHYQWHSFRKLAGELVSSLTSESLESLATALAPYISSSCSE